MNYNHKQCPICRAWIGDDPHTCATNLPRHSNDPFERLNKQIDMINACTSFVDSETKDYLRRIAEALEDISVALFAEMPKDKRQIVLEELAKEKCGHENQ